MFLVVLLIDIYTFVIFVGVVLSWLKLSPDNPVLRVTNALTEPVFRPIRKLMPDLGGLDFSPMLVILALQVVRRLLV